MNLHECLCEEHSCETLVPDGTELCDYCASEKCGWVEVKREEAR